LNLLMGRCPKTLRVDKPYVWPKIGDELSSKKTLGRLEPTLSNSYDEMLTRRMHTDMHSCYELDNVGSKRPNVFLLLSSLPIAAEHMVN
jgi:hypothetical protein